MRKDSCGIWGADGCFLETTIPTRRDVRATLSMDVGAANNAKASQPLGPAAPVRVVVVGPSLRQLGGQSVQVDLLLRQWRGDKEVDASFVAIDPSLQRGWEVLEHIPYVRTVVRELRYITTLWRELRKSDVAHVFVASYASFLIVLLPVWLIGTVRDARPLVHYHSGEAQDHLSRSRLARYLLRKATKTIVPSGYLVDVFHEFGIETKAIPNIINFDGFTYRRRARFGPHFICTRGFHHYYQIDDVLRAFAGIQREFPSAQLTLLGTGETEAEMRRLAQDLGLANVKFMGTVPRRHIGEYYDRADIFINASILDNMPVSILEAFASGTPVITTAPGGIRYIVEHGRTGLLCPPGDWKALAENAVRVLREPDLAQRIAVSGHEELKRYSWENVRPQWLQVYRSMLPNPDVPALPADFRTNDSPLNRS